MIAVCSHLYCNRGLRISLHRFKNIVIISHKFYKAVFSDTCVVRVILVIDYKRNRTVVGIVTETRVGRSGVQILARANA